MTELEATIQAIKELTSQIAPAEIQAQIEEFDGAMNSGTGPSSPSRGDRRSDELYAKLRRAARERQAEFMELVSRMGTGSDTPLYDMYVALAPEAGRWRTFYLAEVKRLLDVAETCDRRMRQSIRSVMLGMIPAIEADSVLWGGIRDCLWDRLGSASPSTRRFILHLLDEVSPNDGDEALARMLEGLKSDKDWRIRYLAHRYGNDLARRPLNSGIPVLDRLRAALSDPTGTP